MMRLLAAALCFALLVSQVNSQSPGQPVAPNARVMCFTDEQCGGTQLSADTTALECCAFAQMNATSFRTIPGDGEQTAVCLECFLIGFSQLRYEVQRGRPSDAVTIELLGGRSSDGIRLDVSTGRINDPNNMLRNARTERLTFATGVPRVEYTAFSLNSGDGIALQPDLMFQVGLSPANPIPSGAGVILSPSTADIIVHDPDIIQLSFTSDQFEALEGTALRPIVSRTLINLARNLTVTVTPGVIPADFPLSPGQFPAQIEDFDPTPQTIIFSNADGGRTSADVDIPTVADDINERMEIVQFTLSVASEDVNSVNIAMPTSLGQIADDDPLSIGFSPRVVNVTEGSAAIITIIESTNIFPLNGGRRQTAQTMLDRAQLLFTPDTAVAADYTFDASQVPDFTTTNLLLNDLVINNAVTAVADGILERTETFIVEVAAVLDQYNVDQRIGDVEVNILDADSLTIRIESPEYTVRENEGPHEVCVVAEGATIGAGIVVELQLQQDSFTDMTAIDGQDYDVPAANALLVSFEMNQNRSCFNIPITNDEISEPTPEIFTITLPPTTFPGLDITVDPTPSTINIIDDDPTEVRYEQSSYTFGEADGTGDIVVLLDGSVVTDVSVTVFEIGGSFSQEITFPSASGADQSINVSVPIVNNEIALEDNLVRRFGLRELSTTLATIGSPSETTVTIVDEDVVNVTFGQAEYTFSEGDGQGTVTVQIDREIAKTLQVNVFGSSPPQNNVVISGGSVDQDVQFSAGSTAGTSQSVTVAITDDDVSLESVEEYPLAIRNPSITTNVQLGPNTNIRITDNDATAIRYEQPSYTFGEADGTGNIVVLLDGSVVTDVSVTVFEIGGSFSQEITFPSASGADQSINVSVPIVNNEIALEDDLVRRFGLRELSTTLATIGSPSETTVNIVDEDVVEVTFGQIEYTFSEGDPQGTATVQINREIAKALQVNVFGSSPPQNNVVISGGSVDQDVQFSAGSTAGTSQSVTIAITDDNVSLESVEEYPLAIRNPSITTNVQLGPNTNIRITDNDATTVQFVQTTYTFSESVGTAEVQVTLSNPVARPVTATVTGGPGTQPAGVVVSGSDVNQQVNFPAGGTPTPVSVQFPVTNDAVAREPNEVYQLSVTTTTTGVTAGPDTTITITDDDSASVQFEQPTYSFTEGQGDGTITVVLNGAVSSPLSVTVTDGTLTEVVTFEALTPDQEINVTIPITDNNIALEPDIVRDFRLEQISDPNIPAVTPSTTTVTIVDDDTVRVGFIMAGYTFSESATNAMVTLRASNPVASPFTVRVQGGPGTQPPSVVISGSDINQVFTFPASTTAETISVPVGITDDEIGLEEPEVYRLLLTDVDQRVTLAGDDLFSTTLITIEDDDVVTVTVDTPALTVPEDGSTVDVCVSLSRDAAVPVTVNFNTIETSATVGADFNIVSSSVTIPAGQRNGCVQYEILMDSIVEGDEMFTAQISTVTTGAVIGNPSGTVVTITDMTPTGCTVSQLGSIVTFPGEPDGEEYRFARPCEHALLSSCAMNAISPNFGVFIDTTDGTLNTASLGVRLNDSTVIVDSNGAVTSTGTLITVQEMGNGMVFITIPSLNVRVMRTNTQVTVSIDSSSSLVRDCGLCGTRTGDLVLPNGNTVTEPSEQFITAFMTPPTDTFVLPNREQCGLMVNDSVRGDPVYTVPIQTSDARPTETLCYEIYGAPDQYFNLVSDECVNVNAHYSAFDRAVRPLHIVDQIAIRAVDSTNQCINIAARVDDQGQCRVALGGQELQNNGGVKYSQSGITVRSYARRARVTVPNCDNNRLVMWVICEERFGYHMIFFKISRGFNLRPSSHGLIAQFWNIPTTVSKFTGALPGGDNSKAYTVTIRPTNSTERRVGAFRENIQWDQTPLSCLYAGNSQGGALSEFQGLDNLIEGSLEDYHMDSPFDTSYRFERFNEDTCPR